MAYRKVFAYSVAKGPEFSLEVKKEATDVTYEMLQRQVYLNTNIFFD